MSKFILGGILAAISLMAIYGTTASDQVISRIDGTERPKPQSNFGQNSDEMVWWNSTHQSQPAAKIVLLWNPVFKLH